jgi:hypothetical protein
VNEKSERMWKEVVVAYCKLPFRYIPGRTEETHQTLKSIACVWAEI